MNYLSLMLKNLRNNPLRAALTMAGVAAAVFVFCFFQSMQSTMLSVVEEAGRHNNLVSVQEHTWCPTQSVLPDDYSRQFASLPHVEDAMPVYIASTSC